MNPFIAALCALLLFASVGGADVRYVSHVEVRRTAAADRGHIPDLPATMQALPPAGDAVTYVGADSVRIEQSRGTTKSVLLLRPDGQFILDPAARTYMRVAGLGEVLKNTDALSSPAFRRTGEFATILGIRAERIEFTMSVALPIIPPPGFPTVMRTMGEVWMGNLPGTDGKALPSAIGLATPTLPAGLEGIVLRQTLRSDEFGYEVAITVTELVEGPVPMETFSVPSNYRLITRAPLP